MQDVHYSIYNYDFSYTSMKLSHTFQKSMVTYSGYVTWVKNVRSVMGLEIIFSDVLWMSHPQHIWSRHCFTIHNFTVWLTMTMALRKKLLTENDTFYNMLYFVAPYNSVALVNTHSTVTILTRVQHYLLVKQLACSVIIQLLAYLYILLKLLYFYITIQLRILLIE